MVIGFIVISSILIAALTVSISANIRFGQMLMNVEDNTQSCVDIIDKRYFNLVHVFDGTQGVISEDPLVRSFFQEVENTRDDMIKIANLISRSTEQLSDIGEENKALAQGSDPSEAQTDNDNGFLVE